MYLIFLGTLKISVCTIVYPLQNCIKYYRQKKKKKKKKSFSPIEDTSNAWPLNHNNGMITIIFRLCICLTEEIFGAIEISLLP